MTAPRIPPLQGLLAFEALARLRSVTAAAEELCVTPSAVSHRIRQLELQLGTKLFVRADFSLTVDGSTCLATVRDALGVLSRLPGIGNASVASRTRLRLAVTPTFSRQILLPRLGLFRHAYPEIELVLQVTIPLLHITAEEADIELRYGTGPYPDRECVRIQSDILSPVCSPEYVFEAGPFDHFDTADELARARLIRCPLEPWRTWLAACDLPADEPSSGAQFNDIGLVLDAAVAGFGVALMPLKLGAAWLDSGRLVRLSERSVASPHHYFLCWKPGTLDRWECAAFVDWLKTSLR